MAEQKNSDIGQHPAERAIPSLPIVGIGASAGGIRALQALFEALPEKIGAAFVVVVHLDPESPSELPRILAGKTRMPVSQIEAATALLADHVYIIPPNRRLRITDHEISAVQFDEPRGKRAPIDLFFRSLADQHGDGFAIILTGAGSDGTVGVKAVKEAGGIILVQEPEEAEYPSMPRSAIATGLADFVLPVRELGIRLCELIRNREVTFGQLGDEDEEHVRRILAHIRVRTGHDFSNYKRSTVLRRIARRVQVTKQESLASYYTFLSQNAEEVQALFSDLLISVTTFFRDGKAFEALAAKVIPRLFDGRDEESSIRVWVPGCATGEEPYTIGILLLEEAARHDLRPEIQIFGSDLDAGALAIAREGRYPMAIEADVSEERLRRFFLREGDHYRVKRDLRDLVVFAKHNLLKDPPFSHIDIVSCRNLLIYLNRELQQQACSIFRYALNADGFLLLGSSETAESPPGLFQTVDREARIYKSAGQSAEVLHALPKLHSPSGLVESMSLSARTGILGPGANEAVRHRQALERAAPPSILVNASHKAVHFSESAGRYVQPAGGPLTGDVSELVRPELRFDLRAALYRAFERGEATLTLPILVQFNGLPRRVNVQVRPIRQEPDTAVNNALVMFIEGEAVEPSDATTDVPTERRASEQIIRQLKEELQLTQGRLRTTREESEAANEELRAANEELQSINEEYRSTSEELETSKEELQSINEELITVNNELKVKFDSVSQAHSDMQNLMAATDLGVLFVDSALRIKRFTPRITDLFSIKQSDEGRPITDLTHQLEYDRIADDARSVLEHLAPIERELRSRNGRWYLMRLRPYRTVDDKINGAVLTFVDITERRNVEEALRGSQAHLLQERRLIELSLAPIFTWDFDGGILEWNRGSEQLYGYKRDEARGQKKDALLKTSVPGSSFTAFKQELLDKGSWFGELQHTTKDGRKLIVEAQLELVIVGDRRLVLESTRDITDSRAATMRRSP